MSHDSTVSFSYSKAIAPATLTRYVVPIILSFSTPKNQNLFYKNKSVIDLANDADYQTMWLSSQDKVGLNDTSIGMIGTHASYSSFASGNNIDDLDLVALAKERLKKNEKQLVVFHLVGSHAGYRSRYDKLDEDAIFETTIYEAPLNNDESKFKTDTKTILDYNRAIHHTDRVLNDIYKLMISDNTPSLLLYISDHSEIIGFGHGFSAHGTKQLDVPFIYINNSSLSIDSIVEKYITPELFKLNSSNLIYILSEILGYKVSDELVKKALNEGLYIFYADNKVYDYNYLKKEYKD